jgi:hypothetical protein
MLSQNPQMDSGRILDFQAEIHTHGFENMDGHSKKCQDDWESLVSNVVMYAQILV